MKGCLHQSRWYPASEVHKSAYAAPSPEELVLYNLPAEVFVNARRSQSHSRCIAGYSRGYENKLQRPYSLSRGVFMKNKVFKLKNGLKVLLVESRKSPVVSVQMWVRTGSADEKKGEEGISHFIEHLLFKGTRKFKTGEIASLVEGNGGELNAYTSYDQTVFYVTIESHKRHIALDVISEMMGFPAFDPLEIDNERGVVIEEIKRGEDSLGSVAWKTLFSTVYKKHAYKEPIIGYEKNIQTLSAQKIRKFYESRYVPSNMFLVVTGDFHSPTMQKEVEGYFKEFKPFKLEKRKRRLEPKQKTARVKVVESKFKKTQAYIAWPIPSIQHKDIPALDLLALIMGTGDSSRLSRKLRLENLFAQSVGAFSYSPLDSGVFAISMTGETNNILKGFQEALVVGLDLMSAPPSNEELKKALTISASESIYSMETVDGLSRKMGSDEFYMKDPNYFEKYLKHLYATKPDEISKVARKYLTPEHISAVMFTEVKVEQSKKEISSLLKWYKKEFKKATARPLKKQKFSVRPLRMSTKKEVATKTKVVKRDSGLTVVLRKQADTPTFSVRCAAMGGLRAEDKKHGGAMELMSRVWTAGSEKYSEEEINHITDSLSASISAFGGRNTVGLTLDGLSPSQEELYPVFFDLLTKPSWNIEVIERERSVQLHQITNKKDNPAQVCFQKFHEMVFRDHPYSRDILGTADSLKTINQDILAGYHKNLIGPKNLVISAVGDFDEKLLNKWIEKIEKELSQVKKFEIKIEEPQHVKNEVGQIQLQKEQTHIVLGYPGLRIDSNERFTLDILQSVLSGQGGRLFLELRDKNSLAYTVSPVRMEGIERGYFGTYIGCSPEKTEKAIQMMREELKKLTRELIAPEELERAQNYLIGQQAISLQRKSSICQAILLDVVYGMPADHIFEVIHEYQKVTREDVKNLAVKLFSQNEIMAIVGPNPLSHNEQLRKSINSPYESAPT